MRVKRSGTNFIVSLISQTRKGADKTFPEKNAGIKKELKTKFICSHGLSLSLLFQS